MRENRPEIDNNFSATRNPTVFEGTKINGETVESIHKILSALILFDGKVIGVMQVPRKDETSASVGIEMN